MLSRFSSRPVTGNNDNSFGDDLEEEIGLLLGEQKRQETDDLEKELNLYRSGSAPPTVEGSFSAVGSIFKHGGGGATGAGGDGSGGFSTIQEFARNKNGNGFISEEQLRSDPAYSSYYYANVNMNPRLPPPLLSKEDWRFAKRLQGGSSAIGDRRNVTKNDTSPVGRSLFSMPPGFNPKEELKNESEQLQGSVEWGGDGLIGLQGLGLGAKQKSIAEIFQDDLNCAPSSGVHLSHPTSCNAFVGNDDSLTSAESELSHIRHDLSSSDPLRSTAHGLSGAHNVGLPPSYSYAAVLGASLSRSTTPDTQRAANGPSRCVTPIGGGRVTTLEKNSIHSPNTLNGVNSSISDPIDLVASLASMNLSNGSLSNTKQHAYLKKSESAHYNYPSASQRAQYNSGSGDDHHHSSILQSNMQKSAFASNGSYIKASPSLKLNGGAGLHCHHPNFDSSYSSYDLNGQSANFNSTQHGSFNFPPLYENAAAASALEFPRMDSRFTSDQHLGRIGNHIAAGPAAMQAQFMDPMYVQYLLQLAARNGHSSDQDCIDSEYINLLQKASNALSYRKPQFGVAFNSKSMGSNNHHGYYGNPAFGVSLSYPGSPMACPVIPNSPVGPGSPVRHGDYSIGYLAGLRNSGANVMGTWNLDNTENGYPSLLEEFKGNKGKCIELSEIAGHVVEFSADQYGSRFIQQRLETATTEEKNMVFQEIIPHAFTLMTDVFGNYVIQKFFEHGIATQRRELANKIFGSVLTLSLQMYGCRVIQKAIEVVDVDQKIKMVEELDDHVMRCVRDQNGNHVIQKCIECVPEDHIQFIISTFFGQVVTLSAHPYGCRVIQRVLEHCKDPQTQSKVMEEILASVSTLAQDQYGNYVIQHVLEHGKPHERSIIIQELAGKIVHMSQQKFASNVVEKCLTFGEPNERQLLVNEMLGATDENEPLQAMMKDQFANYVVQKVLETCSDQERELILSRIKVHLNALKKYTYGKHIVTRVEKLVAAGERRMAAQVPNVA
ncbi:unnamed protein product [Cuscuta europaea]|uniref:PUM-HD domain-containing protein n=1 Tax=Cuscuta europaea TaxID=41803 RepID=A0A9P0ZBH4_CUSEU|nr:unnamed protein product [Cuscuta europaea]